MKKVEYTGYVLDEKGLTIGQTRRHETAEAAFEEVRKLRDRGSRKRKVVVSEIVNHGIMRDVYTEEAEGE